MGDIPDEEWIRLRALGFDAVWLMGVWERSPAARKESLLPEHHPSYLGALHDWSESDVTGSPYAIRRYAVDPHLGGENGLSAARQAMHRNDLALILDFVPNHVAPDHVLTTRPDIFIRQENGFVPGRDPYSEPWRDTIQLNAFSPKLRELAANTLLRIAAQCDGVRCDMAMLVLNGVFARTWRLDPPEHEYWTEVLQPLRAEFPDFFVCAEAYWDTEWRLQQLGFDACYDKRLYDRLMSADVPGLRAHLNAAVDYQNRLIRFLENHDEQRAGLLGTQRHKAAAVILFSLPGCRLVFDGQLDGARLHLPVRLGRAPQEPSDLELRAFYEKLLPLAYRNGEWSQATVEGWPDNPTSQNLLSWTWRTDDYIWWIIVNYSPAPSQGMVQFNSVPARPLRLVDALQDIEYSRDGAQIARQGLFVSLGAWEFHYFRVVPSH